MKTLYQDSSYNEITERLDKLNLSAKREWGKMTVSQMMAHCCAPLEVAMGRKSPPRLFIGRLLGGLMKGAYVGEKQFSKNSPTDKSFLVIDERNFEQEKATLEKLLKEFHDGGPEKSTTHPHSFFGKLTAEEWGISMYKHMDHHLRQFGA